MTRLMAVKLRRDLRATWPRLALMVAAIAVSLIVFGGVLNAWAAVGLQTRSAYLGTEPASATIVLEEAIPVERMAVIAAEVNEQPGVLAASGRTQFDSEIEINGRPRDMPLQVFVAAPDDPLRLATFAVRQADWPPSPGEIFVGRDSLTLLDVAVGDVVTLEAPTGDRVSLAVAGTVYDPSLAPAPQEQRGHAYLSTAALEPAVLNQLKLQIVEPGQTAASRDRAFIVRVAGEVGAWLEQEHGITIREIQVPEPYAHPHQGQADALLLALLAGGAAALLLSAILVANMLNGLFAQQIPQIGILKAIGARSGHVGSTYLAMTLLVAAAAVAFAIVPAILIGRAGTQQVLGFLGIEASSFSAPWWTAAVIIAVGLVLPPLLALIPLVKASRTTVRAAMDHRGLSATPAAATGVLARLGHVRWLDRGLLMALRNSFRRPARFLLCVGLLASAGTVFIAGMSVSAGVSAIADEQRVQRNWDVEVQLASPAAAGDVTAIAEAVPGVTRVEGWYRVQAGVAGPGQIPLTRTYPDQGHGGVAVTVVPAGTTMLPPPELLEGRWLEPGETGAVVLNQVIRRDTVPGVRAGDTVQLFIGGAATSWRVAGIVQERQAGGGVYATAEGFAAAVGQPPRVNQLRIATERHDEQTRTTVADAVDVALGEAGIQVELATSVSRSDAVAEGHLGPVIIIVLGIAVALGVVGGIGLASTMSASVLDRTREFGVMHAIGARPRAVRRIVVAEGVFLAVASGVVALVPAGALTVVLGAGLGNLFMAAPVPVRFSALAVGIWLALVVVGAILATDAAAARASRITVREALAYV